MIVPKGSLLDQLGVEIIHAWSGLEMVTRHTNCHQLSSHCLWFCLLHWLSVHFLRYQSTVHCSQTELIPISRSAADSNTC